MGERLQEVRKRRGLTQRQLASESGVSLSLIRKPEQGDRTGAIGPERPRTLCATPTRRRWRWDGSPLRVTTSCRRSARSR
ncbi:helix-turn-helix domain-containing protein [Streptomyces zinciresistens]|uniref:helix-turn-helix domain-containing protein n=1 Tax=Streptomyces zinciresistens TaxID=1073330 RepID=UPI003CC69C8C